MTFSFHPVKPVTTGEGGMVMTNDPELYKKLIRFRSHGITRDAGQMTKEDGGWYYEQLDLGYNYRMTDIQCALGISQMKKLDRFLKRRKELAERYDEAFADCKNIITPHLLDGVDSGWHLYEKMISLPLYPMLTDGEQDYVIEQVKKYGLLELVENK